MVCVSVGWMRDESSPVYLQLYYTVLCKSFRVEVRMSALGTGYYTATGGFG